MSHLWKPHYLSISWGFWAHFYRGCFLECYIRKQILNEAASIANVDEKTHRQQPRDDTLDDQSFYWTSVCNAQHKWYRANEPVCADCLCFGLLGVYEAPSLFINAVLAQSYTNGWKWTPAERPSETRRKQHIPPESLYQSEAEGQQSLTQSMHKFR